MTYKHKMLSVVMLEWSEITDTYNWGPQFSMGGGISSQAAEFSLCNGILIFPQNFAEIKNSPATSTIFVLMTYFCLLS